MEMKIKMEVVVMKMMVVVEVMKMMVVELMMVVVVTKSEILEVMTFSHRVLSKIFIRTHSIDPAALPKCPCLRFINIYQNMKKLINAH